MTIGEDLLNILAMSVVALAFAGAIALFLAFGYHFVRTTQEPKGKREDRLINLLAPFSLFFPGLHSPKGEHHRRRMFLYMVLFLLCLAVLFGFKTYVNWLEA